MKVRDAILKHPQKLCANKNSAMTGAQSRMAPARHKTCDPMKPPKTLKSLTELTVEVMEIESEKPSRGASKQRLADNQPPQETPLPDPTPEFSGFAGYPHWGLNE
jgi:hypothetical protein